MPGIIHKFGIVILAAVGLILVAKGRSHGQDDLSKPDISSSTVKGGLATISKRGPGMKGPAYEHLTLPVPRTFDLTHVEPEHFAAALGKDPQRIFEFVRDHVAYEVYSGCLRGPRGTLLAMAGNSVDRAALLAALLEKSGQRVRFVRGTLPEADAKELVTSMWAKRPRPAPKASTKTTPALKEAMDTFVTNVKRDYKLIYEHLKKTDNLPARQPGPSMEILVKQTQPHYWVQWSKDNQWVDLDPSFADSVPGRTHANAKREFAALPEEVYHRVTIRIQLEEYGIYLQGNAETKPSKREILHFRAKAADLSGLDLVLTHQPENWQGPAKDLQSALAATIKDTGKVKPVLLTGLKQWVAGEPFRPKTPADKGLGGVGNLLSGAGTRQSVPVATGESLEFEFVAPDGSKETVVRPIFDLVGMARRGEAKNLTGVEVRAKVMGEGILDLTRAVFSLYFSTGSIQETHLRTEARALPGKKVNSLSARRALRAINITMVAVSDRLLANLGKGDRTIIRSYPNSPRVQIVDLTRVAGKQRLTIDLRRDHTLALDLDDPFGTFSALVFHGVVNGTLERVLAEYITAESSRKKLTQGLSTSSLFDQAMAEGIPTRVLWGDAQAVPNQISRDTLARLRRTLANGFLLVVPQQGIRRGTENRLAWWQIDPRSGKTIAVTDEGLHGTTAERTVHVTETEEGEIEVVVEENGIKGVPERMQWSEFSDSLSGFHGNTYISGPAFPFPPIP